MASELYTANRSVTLRLDDGRDFVLAEGDTQLAAGHPAVRERPDLFQPPDNADPKAKRRSPTRRRK